MLAVLVPAVMDAAACNDDDVAVFTDIKIIGHHIPKACLCNYHRNAAALIDGAVGDPDIDACSVLLRSDLYVLCGLAGLGLTVVADVISPLWDPMDLRHLFQYLLFDSVHLDHLTVSSCSFWT